MVNATNAQNNTDIAGMYALVSSSPEGGSQLIVLENGKYAIMYFGGIQVGNWELAQGDVYRFAPNPGTNQFELYGRHNKNLSNETKILFNGFENGETFMHAGATKDGSYRMKRIFNSGANGYSFPYVHTFKTTGDIIAFMSKNHHQDTHSFATFKNPEGYNDLVANFAGENHVRESRPFTATFKYDKLYFEDDNYSQRSPLDEDEIRELIDQEMNRETLYFNRSYNRFEDDIHEYHVFNEQKGAYIDTEYYEDGEEHIKSEESFDSMSIIYAFEALKDYTTGPVKYSIDENAIFQVDGSGSLRIRFQSTLWVQFLCTDWSMSIYSL